MVPGLLRAGLRLCGEGGVLDQVGEVALFGEGLAQQRRTMALLLLRSVQCNLGRRQVLFQLCLAFAQDVMLLAMTGNLFGQGRQLPIYFQLAGELVPLRGQLLQPCQLQALVGQRLPLLLDAFQLFVRHLPDGRPATAAVP